MKYKPKPRIVDMIDAMQWDGTLSGATVIRAMLPNLFTLGFTAHMGDNTVAFWQIQGPGAGKREVRAGDWIITDLKGEHYLCAPDVFADTFEPA